MDKKVPKKQKELPETVFTPETKAQDRNPLFDAKTPSDFLASKGFTQVHEGQKFPGTYEDVINLLQEYKAL